MFRSLKAVESKGYAWMNDEHLVCIPFGFQGYASRSRGAWVNPVDPEILGEHQVEGDNWVAVQSMVFSDGLFNSESFSR